MRKNLLVAALVGFCVMGLTACQRSENKTNDTTTTAMTQEQAPADQVQVAPEQTADASSANQAAPVDANQQQAAADANQAPADQNNAITTADSSNAAPAVDSNNAATDSNSNPSSN